MTFQIGDLVIINKVSLRGAFHEERYYGLLHGEPATITLIGDLKRNIVRKCYV